MTLIPALSAPCLRYSIARAYGPVNRDVLNVGAGRVLICPTGYYQN
jgi:hypothetical protein